MYRLLSLERGRRKRRLELSLAGIYELEMLKQRHETLISRALALHAPDSPIRTHDDCSPRRPPDTSWSLMNILQHQVGELRVDTDSSSVEPPTDAGDPQHSSGLCEQIEAQSSVSVLDSSGLSEISQWSAHSVHLTERPKSAGDVFAVDRDGNSGMRAVVPRSLSAPHPPLEGITEGLGEDELWSWRSADEDPTAEDYRKAQRVETFILSLIQRRSLSLRPNKPRTSLGPETRGVVRQAYKESPYSPERSKSSPSPERHAWSRRGLDDEQHVRYPKPALAGIRSTSLDFPCAALDPSSSETESPQHFQGYPPPRSASSDEQLVNGQYIPAQPCHAQTRATPQRAHVTPKPARGTYSPERVPAKTRAAQKKCRFTEEKVTSKKPGRKACRAQSENSLLGQRVSERKYNTVERDASRSVQPKTRRPPGASGHRRWRSTLELSQDEAEPPPEQPIRRSRKPRPAPPPCVYSQPSQHHHQPHLRAEYPQRAPLCLPDPVAGESESSLSEAESPGSSSLSSDSDESGGLVWPQQLPPQLAPPSPPAGTSPQPKAFVKIKASHALKKKILRFRTGSLKVMTTV
ncbi:dapper homolog 3 [Triplophysa rosa]|uniref:Dapper-like protein 3 n=1 Tax=Triplophysa rosa TaxID=992332 RepID=A0A9W7TBC2_TRIRA|nr:dapper homolog 3 [Triplophysa rosa]KAI7793044.1 putative dapper-like protein 3 [Triplophysa rosa]